MGQIENTISVYERLRRKKYKITIENGMEIILEFDKKFYHHLAGFHYLTDLAGIADPVHGKARFYQRLKNGRIPERDILRSERFGHIAERIAHFDCLEEILAEGKGKIIVEFDRRKASSEIEARFFLYKREGNPLIETVTYYMLFLGCKAEADIYYPATYIIEHSVRYITEQNLLDCEIEWTKKDG